MFLTWKREDLQVLQIGRPLGKRAPKLVSILPEGQEVDGQALKRRQEREVEDVGYDCQPISHGHLETLQAVHPVDGELAHEPELSVEVGDARHGLVLHAVPEVRVWARVERVAGTVGKGVEQLRLPRRVARRVCGVGRVADGRDGVGKGNGVKVAQPRGAAYPGLALADEGHLLEIPREEIWRGELGQYCHLGENETRTL